MTRKLTALSVALVAVVVAACSGHSGGSMVPGTTTYTLPALGGDLVVTANLPPKTVGEELPSQGVGQIKSSRWHANLGGFTQMRYAQSLAFPPGTKITVRNLAKNTDHTFNVVKEISGPPARFPQNPDLSTHAQGNGKLEVGYASGIIKPGKSVTVTLAKEGIFLIGCAFHYSQGMHDVIVVKRGARPGPQATPAPSPSSSGGGGGGGGW